MEKLLSIIIVSFNSKYFLDKCLASLSKSSLDKKKQEIIIIDNASTDGTFNYIRKKYPHLTIEHNLENLGFAKANNKAIEKAKGKYVLLLNPDTIVPENCLLLMTSFMEKNKQAAVSTCRVELPDGTLDDACHRGYPTPWNAFCHFTYLSAIFPQSFTFNGYHLGYRNLGLIHEIDSCAGAFMLIRRKIGEKLNWLDEDYFWYGEDLDFCFRVKKANFRVYFVPTSKIIHYKGISSGLKRHSRNLSTADKKTRIKATQARFAVMRIFYRKHYQKSREKLLSRFILAVINIKEKLSLISLKMHEN